MRFVAIEYDIPNTSNHVKGYLRIPDNVPANWHMGYYNYLREEKSIVSDIKIYPLNVHLDSNTMGKVITGYTNLEDEFNLALRSNKYYPISEEYDAVRRSFSKLDPMSPDYMVKGR